MIPVFPDAVGCISPDGYRYGSAPAMDRHPALKGRPRYRLKDVRASDTIDTTIVMSAGQFAAWQEFWTVDTDNGAKWFRMRLRKDLADPYIQGIEVYTVHATGPWSASLGADYLWTVSLQVEVPGAGLFTTTVCPVIYGGPITDLKPDTIYGGPIDDLKPDIIAPCPYVEPQP